MPQLDSWFEGTAQTVCAQLVPFLPLSGEGLPNFTRTRDRGRADAMVYARSA